MKISIIIPTFNEADRIHGLVLKLQDSAHDPEQLEIIVVDGGSTDATVDSLSSSNIQVLQSAKGRAVQMNTGARAAAGDVLYFLHADSVPPQAFDRLIWQAVQQGAQSGTFCMRFDKAGVFLRLCSWMTRIIPQFRFGDHSYFVTQTLFAAIEGFDERLTIMEDVDLCKKLRAAGRSTLVKQCVTTSSRAFITNGPIRLHIIFFILYMLYVTGRSQSKLLRTYKRYVKKSKI